MPFVHHYDQPAWSDPNYVATLKQTMFVAPDVTGDNFIGGGGGGGDQSDLPPPDNRHLKVNPGSMRDMENRILTELKTQIPEFEDFKASVRARMPWVFFCESADQAAMYWHEGASGRDPISQGTYADFFDPDPDTTAQRVQQADLLLNAAANCHELLGNYMAALNNSAQVYAHADEITFPPGWQLAS